MDLNGTWRAAASEEQRRRVFHERDHDDSEWFTVAVPGHWAEVPELASEDSVLYRRRFTGPDHTAPTSEPAPPTDSAATVPTDTTDPNTTPQIEPKRWWLCLEGLAQQGDVWLDGTYLGHTDGYFVPHEMEITEQIAARRDHILAVEATCRRFGDPDNRSTLTGALQDPEIVGSNSLIVGGLWRPVRIRSSGQIAIRYARVVCLDVKLGDNLSGLTRTPHPPEPAQTQTPAHPPEPAQTQTRTRTRLLPQRRTRARTQRRTRARLAMRVVLDVPHPTTVQLRTKVAGTDHVHTHSAAAGENRVEWPVDVEDPALWWPHALGEQALHDLTVEVVTDTILHDRRCFRIGFRKVSMRRFVMRVNGERIHLKGANLLPVRTLPGTASPEEVAEDVRAARSAGLDLVRPVAHITRPEFYKTADELGILVWQDLPIRGLMSRSVGNQARRQAREAVDLLGHHPSLVVWCAHDEPFVRPKRPTALPPVVAGKRQVPSWNRDVLDRRLCRVLNRCDGSRPVVPHTAVPPHLSDPDGTTSNVWLGWRGGHASDLGKALARVPRMGRFVSAFGTPVAEDAAEVVKTTIETLRRLKYRPNGGFLLSTLTDMAGCDINGGDINAGDINAHETPNPEPGKPRTNNPELSGFGALDAQRQPKPSWAALIESCRPLIVVADHLPPTMNPDRQINLAVHVVSDLREAVEDLTVRAQILSTGTLIASRSWTGTIRADECTLVGRIKASIPENHRPATSHHPTAPHQPATSHHPTAPYQPTTSHHPTPPNYQTPHHHPNSEARHTTPASLQPSRSHEPRSQDLLVVELELRREETVVARNRYQAPIHWESD